MWILLAVVCAVGGQCQSDYRGKFETLERCAEAGRELRNVSSFLCHPYIDDAGQPV